MGTPLRQSRSCVLIVTGKQYGTKITTRKVNVGNVEQVTRWVEDTYAEFGRLDGAANVAGVAGGDGDATVETIVRSHPFPASSAPRPCNNG